MDRRDFLKISGLSLVAVSCGTSAAQASEPRHSSKYSIVILGDTHFDTDPPSVYHSLYNEPVQWLNDVQRKEFARNASMWSERCPRMLRRAASLVDGNTRMILQTGDLIQGDCGAPEVHRKMLCDVMDSFKKELGGLPFVTVAGNHDIRGNYDIEGRYDSSGSGALKVYSEYMPGRMSEELGQPVTKTTFSFWIGRDAYIVIDFNNPDDTELDRLLQQTVNARNTFILVHGPVFPYDGGNCRWIFHGGASEKETAARLHFRKAFAERHAIVLCGHTHCTELADWHGDGGRITQMTMNSVWSDESKGKYTINASGAEQYGELRKKINSLDNGTAPEDETPFFDEYRAGLKSYLHSPSAGSYKMTVSGRHVLVDFYPGDSPTPGATFVIR